MSDANLDKQRQHYVPRALLAHYAGPAERLHVFDKHTGRAFPGATTVKKICREHGYYNAAAPHGQVTLEQALHPLEDAFPAIAARITKEKSLAGLSAGEFSFLAVFIATQFLRVPRMRTAFDQISQLVADKARAIAPQGADLSEIEAQLEENQLRLSHLEAIARGSVEAAKSITRYAWFLMERDAGDPLWLSDCPVVLHNDEKGFYAGLGLNAPGVQISMPLTPDLLIACWYPAVVARLLEYPSNARPILGQLKAAYLLGVRGDKARLSAEIATIENELKRLDAMIAAMRTRGCIQFTADHVGHFNWLQYQWSHRFIMCRKGKFETARRMLKDHPELRTGIGIEDGAATPRRPAKEPK